MLRLNDCKQLDALRPLANCTEVEKLTIPAHCQDIEVLRSLPKLRFLNDRKEGYAWTKTAKQFWQKHDARKKQAIILAGLNDEQTADGESRSATSMTVLQLNVWQLVHLSSISAGGEVYVRMSK